ncbi:MAG: hypothetical protein KAX44_03785, partial [Candidatus Brocadiae bacterium]|nr:hypothetical protein [Candidatus Brocadiia bacterium]
MRLPEWSAAMLCVAMLTAPAVALQPEEVLVVANANVPESVELAEHYAQGRGIPADNIVRVDTTDAYDVSYDNYDRDIRQPLLAALEARTDLPPIRCICLIWGVPVRVGAPPAGGGELAALFRTEAERSHSRLAVARQFLLTVGVTFPAPADDNSLRPADLFEPPPPLPSSLLPLTALQKDIEEELASKTEAALAMTNAAHRAIA